jgi:peroxiredoxin family protein
MKIDPALVVFQQDELRPHLTDSFQKNLITTFPINKRRRIKANAKSIIIYLCPNCKRNDNGTKMIQCETCMNWYHVSCISVEP